jgi:hypothetical protein
MEWRSAGQDDARLEERCHLKNTRVLNQNRSVQYVLLFSIPGTPYM